MSSAEKKKLAKANSELSAENLVKMEAAATPFSYTDFLQQTEEQLDHEASNRRLQVFTEIPESLSDS